jgi:hypothetical protein
LPGALAETEAMTNVTERHDRLAAMRGEIQTLLADVNAAFERMPVDPEAIKYMLYRYRAALAVAEFDQFRAIRLAGKLTEAVSARLR